MTRSNTELKSRLDYPEYSKTQWAWLNFLYEKWWRVETFGLDRIPENGPCLIVGNQGCVLPWQALMLACALRER